MLRNSAVVVVVVSVAVVVVVLVVVVIVVVVVVVVVASGGCPQSCRRLPVASPGLSPAACGLSLLVTAGLWRACRAPVALSEAIFPWDRCLSTQTMGS